MAMKGPSMDLRAVGHLTGLNSMTPTSAMELFKDTLFASPTDTVSVEVFTECLTAIAHLRTLSASEEAALMPTLSTLYALFDANGDGTVGSGELASGLSVLCGGTREEKAAAAFALYDTDGDGVMSFAELESYLVGVFTIMLARSADDATKELARHTASGAFGEAGVELDASLTWAQFHKWHVSKVEAAPPGPPPGQPPRRRAKPPGPPPGPPPSSTARRASSKRRRGKGRKASSFSKLKVDLKFVRRVTGLGSCNPSDVLETFNDAAEDGTLSLAAFEKSFEDFVDESLLAPTDAAQFALILPALYELFDADGDGTVRRRG